jgi:hypothetical protein
MENLFFSTLTKILRLNVQGHIYIIFEAQKTNNSIRKVWQYLAKAFYNIAMYVFWIYIETDEWEIGYIFETDICEYEFIEVYM